MPVVAMRSFLRLNINCPGVSFEDRPTFFVHGTVFRYFSKSFETLISTGSFSGSSATTLSPTAFDPGGPFLSTSETTLYHLLSNIESFSRRIFSISKTLLCQSFFLS